MYPRRKLKLPLPQESNIVLREDKKNPGYTHSKRLDLTQNIGNLHDNYLVLGTLVIIPEKQFHSKVKIRSVTSIPRQRVELVVSYKRADGHQIGKTEIQTQG